MMSGASAPSLYSRDNHCADRGLGPLRYCVNKWQRIASPLGDQGAGEVLKRVALVFLLIVPTLVAVLLALAVFVMKGCCPAQRRLAPPVNYHPSYVQGVCMRELLVRFDGLFESPVFPSASGVIY